VIVIILKFWLWTWDLFFIFFFHLIFIFHLKFLFLSTIRRSWWAQGVVSGVFQGGMYRRWDEYLQTWVNPGLCLVKEILLDIDHCNGQSIGSSNLNNPGSHQSTPNNHNPLYGSSSSSSSSSGGELALLHQQQRSGCDRTGSENWKHISKIEEGGVGVIVIMIMIICEFL